MTLAVTGRKIYIGELLFLRVKWKAELFVVVEGTRSQCKVEIWNVSTWGFS